MIRLILFIAVVISISISSVNSAIILIPDDYPTIQQGINASTAGDTVLVHPDEYGEFIIFHINGIMLGSLFILTGDTSYISTTIINAHAIGPVIEFPEGIDSSSILAGFTLTYGWSPFGGGIYCRGSGPIIRNNIITENGAYKGAGIYCESQSYPQIYSNLICGNETASSQYDSDGAGIYSTGSSPVVSNNIIRNNIALLSWPGYGYGGGISCFYSNAIITNNTIVNNQASHGGGLSCTQSQSTSVVNNIFWGNTASHSDSQAYGIPQISYCNVQGGYPGIGNINQNPYFRNPPQEYYLMAIACGDSMDSPCIDAGQPDIIDDILDCWHGLGVNRSDIGAFGGANGFWHVTNAPDEYIDPIFPTQILLHQNYPNPFNPITTISYTLPSSSVATVNVYNITGQHITTLASGLHQPGTYNVTFNASGLSSGIYFYRLNTGDFTAIGKMILLK
ncbi:hypothetical protein AMJ86_03515 [bacterium SM23_57]|nr:MAG: hypothetical protein AMJ86_03515 [bacterium SM23_57]